jgi:hypothetical protein
MFPTRRKKIYDQLNIGIVKFIVIGNNYCRAISSHL